MCRLATTFCLMPRSLSRRKQNVSRNGTPMYPITLGVAVWPLHQQTLLRVMAKMRVGMGMGFIKMPVGMDMYKITCLQKLRIR